MERLIEFSINHWELVALFVGLLIALIITESRRAGATVSALQATQLINKQDAKVLDIRDAKEYRQGHITDAVNIPFNALEERIGELKPYKDVPIILVCKMGQHSGSAGKILRKKGYDNVVRLSGGLSSWQADNLPLVKG